MKKLWFLTIAFLCIGLVNAGAYTINDPYSSAQTLYSGDRIGDITFELYGLDFSQNLLSNFLSFDQFCGHFMLPFSD